MLALVPAPLIARQTTVPPSTVSAYVEARTAELEGDELRSARLFAAMLKSDPGNIAVARRALVIAIQGGDFQLALSLAKRMPAEQLGFDGRMLLAVDLLRAKRTAEAAALLKQGKTSTENELFAPLVEAWSLTADRRIDGADKMAMLPADSMLRSVAAFHRANMLITLGRREDAVREVAALLNGKGSGMTRQRIELASGLQALGERDAALSALAGDDGPLVRARAIINEGGELPTRIDTPAKAVGELLLALAADLARGENDRGLPLSLARMAMFANPDNPSGTILTALFLDNDDRSGDAIAALRTVAANSVYYGDALDLEARILSRTGRDAEALGRVESLARAQGAPVSDIARLADVLGELNRHEEAARVYGDAIAAANAHGASPTLWTLHLLRASSLEEIDRWPEAKAELNKALALEPENPIILNFLGYGKLERGEDLDAAEAMIRKASAMRPDDASITDSLGWALFKRGNFAEAVETLRRAAAGDPAQSEIQEHLGDALYKAGRRIEARFAWTAAMTTATDSSKPRLESKLDSGLTPSNAAP